MNNLRLYFMLDPILLHSNKVNQNECCFELDIFGRLRVTKTAVTAFFPLKFEMNKKKDTRYNAPKMLFLSQMFRFICLAMFVSV